MAGILKITSKKFPDAINISIWEYEKIVTCTCGKQYTYLLACDNQTYNSLPTHCTECNILFPPLKTIENSFLRRVIYHWSSYHACY